MYGAVAFFKQWQGAPWLGNSGSSTNASSGGHKKSANNTQKCSKPELNKANELVYDSVSSWNAASTDGHIDFDSDDEDKYHGPTT